MFRTTERPDKMSHRKWRETKQQPSRARSGHQIRCCLVSLHVLCNILSGRPVDYFEILGGPGSLILLPFPGQLGWVSYGSVPSSALRGCVNSRPNRLPSLSGSTAPCRMFPARCNYLSSISAPTHYQSDARRRDVRICLRRASSAAVAHACIALSCWA